MKIVFFGTSNLALPVLERLARHHEIAAVVTQPDAPVGRKQEFSESPVSVLAHELEVKVLKPGTIKANDMLRLELEAVGAEVFIVVSYGKIIPAEILRIPPLGVLNVHPSLLPKYRGATPIRAPLLNGEKETGTSIMVMDEELDHGPVLAQERVDIDEDDNYITLEQKLAMVSAELLIKVLPAYASGAIRPFEQDHSKATYTETLSKQDGKIDWAKSAPEITNQFRAYYPWPGIWTTWNGKVLKIADCLVSSISEPSQPPGTVLPGGAVVCGGGTVLEITRLQLEGKTETDILSFLNGYKNFIASKLE